MLKTVKVTKELKDYEKIKCLALDAFPGAEYFDPDELVLMTKHDGFEFVALYADEVFVGYLVYQRYKELTYLFFLAIEEAYRTKGYGSEAIKWLFDKYKDSEQVVDFEIVDASFANYEERNKRRNFYLKNGYKPTKCHVCNRGVDYEIMCNSDNFSLDSFKEMLETFNFSDFNPSYYKEQ